MDNKPENIYIHNNSNKRQNGSALIYVLFILVFVGIVATAMLTTVTYGQRNIVKNEQVQSQFYRAEGAFEIILAVMESYEDPDVPAENGPYFYIKNVIAPSKTYEYTIGGQKVGIVGEVMTLENDRAVVKLYDPTNEKTYRTVTADLEGIVPPPPKDDEDKAYTYLDGYERIFHNDTNLPPEDHLTNNPTITTEGYLVIPESIGTVNFHPNGDVNYSAGQGVFIEAHLVTKATGSISLTSRSGYIIVDEAEFVTHASPKSTVAMNAGTYISAISTKIDSPADVMLKANQYVDVREANINAGKNKTITIEVTGTTAYINVEGAIFNKNAIARPIGVKIIGKPASGCITGGTPSIVCP
jgi:hypothetical protein